MKTPTRAFTLVEILLVLAIIAVLAAVVLASIGPIRARARETTCVSNMRQIYASLEMYRQDFGSNEPVEGQSTTAAQLGFPGVVWGDNHFGVDAGHDVWEDNYVKDKRILRCPDYTPLPVIGVPTITYDVVFESESFLPKRTRFSTWVAKQGMLTPILICRSHNPPIDRSTAPRWTTMKVLVLRLNGQLDSKTVNINNDEGLF